MKRLIFILLIASQSAFGQKEAADYKAKQLNDKAFLPKEFRTQFVATNFSSLFTQTENEYVFGFIGDDYQRIRVRIISINKSKTAPDTYEVYGKSMVKTNSDQFHGTIRITNIRRKKIMSYGVDDMYKKKGLKGEFVIIGDYQFSESRDKKHSGVFRGVFRSNFYLDKGSHIHYDDIENYSDSFNNNQFVGTWTQYDNNTSKRCNWGDYRIPNSGSLDIGAGDFSPADKYLKNGWQGIRDLGSSNPKNAKAIETAKWWL